MVKPKPAKGKRPSRDDIKAKAARAEARSKGEPVEKTSSLSAVMDPPTTLPPGRPSKYSRELADEICDRISGGETLTSICDDAHMPQRQAVLRWKREDLDGFSIRYARAREDQRELWSDEMVDIGDDGRNDWMEKRVGRDETIVVLNKEAVERSKLRSDNRKWLLTKLDRGTYGDKVENTHKADDAFIGLLQMMKGKPQPAK